MDAWATISFIVTIVAAAITVWQAADARKNANDIKAYKQTILKQRDHHTAKELNTKIDQYLQKYVISGRTEVTKIGLDSAKIKQELLTFASLLKKEGGMFQKGQADRFFTEMDQILNTFTGKTGEYAKLQQTLAKVQKQLSLILRDI